MIKPLQSAKRWIKLLKELKGYEKRISSIEDNAVLSLKEIYQSIGNSLSLKDFYRTKEYKVYSQNGEDGLILYLLSVIGVESRTFVEFGIGDGKQCNSANLIRNFGWSGLLIEGNKSFVNAAKEYYKPYQKPSIQQVNILNEFITTDNIDALIERNKVGQNVDVLSIDIDGNDLWVWSEIECINPRLVIIEYNASFGIEQSISIPYKSDFYRFNEHSSGWYHGASLQALNKLATQKGYSLVCCDSHGDNAFFIRQDCLNGSGLNVQSPAQAYYVENKRSQIMNTNKQFQLISNLPLQEF